MMGVSGCGKTTVGKALAQELDCPFYDGDDYHPPDNIAKMAKGLPLNDDDRYPWLAVLHNLIKGHLEKGEPAVLACSALKKKYRDQLRAGNEDVLFIFLHGDFDTIWQRMLSRSGHYMKEDMLQSQFEALETPYEDEAIIVSIDQSVDDILVQISRTIR
jgi:gluconokinase